VVWCALGVGILSFFLLGTFFCQYKRMWGDIGMRSGTFFHNHVTVPLVISLVVLTPKKNSSSRKPLPSPTKTTVLVLMVYGGIRNLAR